MPVQLPQSAEDVIDQPERIQFEAFLAEHRAALNACLDGLTEEQARRSLVASRTTLLGLVKHATFVEKVWFDEAITGRSRGELGIPATPDESFVLDDDDTIATVQRAHREACEASRDAASSLGLDTLVMGNRRGPLPLRWVYLHVLRELAQHCGHADILREQLVTEQLSAARSGALESVVRTDRRRSLVRGVMVVDRALEGAEPLAVTGSAYVDLRAAFKGPDHSYDETHYLAQDGDQTNASGPQRIAQAVVDVVTTTPQS